MFLNEHMMICYKEKEKAEYLSLPPKKNAAYSRSVKTTLMK